MADEENVIPPENIPMTINSDATLQEIAHHVLHVLLARMGKTDPDTIETNRKWYAGIHLPPLDFRLMITIDVQRLSAEKPAEEPDVEWPDELGEIGEPQ